MDGEEYFKLKGAIEKLKNKGGRDSLVITSKAAYIVDVDNNKIVTAIDKNNMAENVFTKIDSTLFVD
jgi:flagellar operon protein